MSDHNDEPAERTRITVATAPNAGAIAIIELHGPDVLDILRRLTGVRDWPGARVRYVKLGEIDEGCAVCLRDPPRGRAQITPHGGVRVVARLIDALCELGCICTRDVPARDLYFEAQNDLEADMLAALARAASPAAIDLLLGQTRIWCALVARGSIAPGVRDTILRQSATFDRLIDPPTVVVVGRPNVGKSTLTNALFGRSLSIVADLPGTTRDWVAGLVELSGESRVASRASWVGGGATPTRDPRPATRDSTRSVAVRWLDTPGLRASDDPIEQRAIGLAARVVAEANVLIAMRDRDTEWPDSSDLPRSPDLKIINKIDAPEQAEGWHEADALLVSAATGLGLGTLQQRVLACLGLDQPGEGLAWAFSATLKTGMRSNDITTLCRYAGL